MLASMWATGWLLGLLLGPLIHPVRPGGVPVEQRGNIIRWAMVGGGYAMLAVLLLLVQIARRVVRPPQRSPT